jgi:hypothetical protein
MPSLTPFRIRERLLSLFSPALDDIQKMAEEDLRVMEVEFQPIEIPKAEVSPPPIPEELSSQQFPQKEFVAGVTELLPSIMETPTPNEEWLFVALTLLESVEDTEAKFFFPRGESQEEAAEAILQWAKAYQEKNYMLPPLMATIHWGIVPQ